MSFNAYALPGGDSATPKPTQYQGKKVWGVYVAGATFHIWSKAEVHALSAGGIEGVMPIVVPPQDREWWTENHGYPTVEALCRAAKMWGLPFGSPICLDIEEGQSSRMTNPRDVLRSWAVACSVHHFRNWVYGSRSFLDNQRYGFRWLAEWPQPTPVNPQLPRGFQGWQYKGQDLGIDHDLFEEGRTYLSPHLTLVTLPLPRQPRIAAVTSPASGPADRPPDTATDTASGAALSQEGP